LKKKVLDCSITDVLYTVNSGKDLYLYSGGLLLLMFLYTMALRIVTTSNGLSYEDNIRFTIALAKLSTVSSLLILFKEFRNFLKEKQLFIESKVIINDLMKELGLSEIDKIDIANKIEENVSVLDVTLSDKQGRIAVLREYRSGCTYKIEDENTRTLR